MTRMIRFRTAALAMSVFIALGALISGAGPAETLGELGKIQEIQNAFLVSLTAALTVLLMTYRGIPVSTSQSVVGAIVGWTLYAGESLDMVLLARIAGTWVFAPVLGGVFGIFFYLLIRAFMNNVRIHMIQMDRLLRLALFFAGVFGSYSLGANNIANVVGMFMNSVQFSDWTLGGLVSLQGRQILFLIGASSVAVGIFTYSFRVMQTVGSRICRLSPGSALAVVLSSGTVLFLFASRELESLLLAYGLPTLPLVPVSQSQTVVGAIVGIGIMRGARQLNPSLIGHIFLGWIMTPFFSMVLSFFLLTFS